MYDYFFRWRNSHTLLECIQNKGWDSANNIAINLKLEKTISRKLLQKERRVEFIYRANDQITICLDG